VALEHLAYEEAKRAIDRQSDALDGLRSRAGILLAAISLATSFFGGLALQDGNPRSRVIVFASLTTAVGILAGAFCVGVLWPRAEWLFNWSARKLLPKLDASADEAVACRMLAKTLDDAYVLNEGNLKRLFLYFRLGCIFLAVETAGWVVTLAL
jgi:hypothetical protein